MSAITDLFAKLAKILTPDQVEQLREEYNRQQADATRASRAKKQAEIEALRRQRREQN